MFEFNKNAFIKRLNTYGIDINEYSDNLYQFPNFIDELPELRTSCFFDADTETIVINSNVQIASNVTNQTIIALCEKVDSLTNMAVYIQDGCLAACLQLCLSAVGYASDDDALENLVAFILYFKQEFQRICFNAFKYATTGNINYIR